jgi:hypothetical protein
LDLKISKSHLPHQILNPLFDAFDFDSAPCRIEISVILPDGNSEIDFALKKFAVVSRKYLVEKVYHDTFRKSLSLYLNGPQ